MSSSDRRIIATGLLRAASLWTAHELRVPGESPALRHASHAAAA